MSVDFVEFRHRDGGSIVLRLSAIIAYRRDENHTAVWQQSDVYSVQLLPEAADVLDRCFGVITESEVPQ